MSNNDILEEVVKTLFSQSLKIQTLIRDALSKNLCEYRIHNFVEGYMDFLGKVSFHELDGGFKIRKCKDCGVTEFHLSNEDRWVEPEEFVSNKHALNLANDFSAKILGENPNSFGGGSNPVSNTISNTISKTALKSESKEGDLKEGDIEIDMSQLN